MRYVPALDGLRGFSIILVVMGHTLSVPGGAIGVDVFFVISGFLITRLFIIEYQDSGTISLPNFFIRRALRLMPALWLMIGTMLLVFSVVHHPIQFAQDVSNAELALAYVTNMFLAFTGGPHHNIFGHTWSLGIEEQFYIVWAIIALFTLKTLRLKQAAIIIFWAICAGYVWSLFLIAQGAPEFRLHGGFDTRASELLVGCIGSVLVSDEKINDQLENAFVTGRVIGIAGLWGLCVLLFFTNPLNIQYFYIDVPIISFCSLVVILDMILNGDGTLSHVLSWSPLVYIGSVSYGFYLWHDPLNWLVIGSSLDSSAIAHVLVSGGGGLAIAALSSRFVEKPILSLKRSLQFRPHGKFPSPARID